MKYVLRISGIEASLLKWYDRVFLSENIKRLLMAHRGRRTKTQNSTSPASHRQHTTYAVTSLQSSLPRKLYHQQTYPLPSFLLPLEHEHKAVPVGSVCWDWVVLVVSIPSMRDTGR